MKILPCSSLVTRYCHQSVQDRKESITIDEYPDFLRVLTEGVYAEPSLSEIGLCSPTPSGTYLYLLQVLKESSLIPNEWFSVILCSSIFIRLLLQPLFMYSNRKVKQFREDHEEIIKRLMFQDYLLNPLGSMTWMKLFFHVNHKNHFNRKQQQLKTTVQCNYSRILNQYLKEYVKPSLFVLPVTTVFVFSTVSTAFTEMLSYPVTSFIETQMPAVVMCPTVPYFILVIGLQRFLYGFLIKWKKGIVTMSNEGQYSDDAILNINLASLTAAFLMMRMFTTADAIFLCVWAFPSFYRFIVERKGKMLEFLLLQINLLDPRLLRKGEEHLIEKMKEYQKIGIELIR